jgi:inosine-uridine nucleoside N-ribohydrolase
MKKHYVLMFIALLAICSLCITNTYAEEKIPVIYDSDIGDDIDDTWAFGFLLQCPEFDVKLVVGDQGKPEYRAKLMCKLLERAGRTDIPVGMALPVNATGGGNQSAWVKDYDLKSFPGKIHKDGVQAIIDTIMNSPTQVTVIAVGPLPNIAEALKREPKIAEKARFVGMHGSVRLGYGGNPKISAEYNVRADAKACQKVLSAPWDKTITPLDTCGLVVLKGDRYAKVRDCEKPIAKAIIENYRVWCDARKDHIKDENQADKRSSTLFDTVAVYLGFSEDYIGMEDLKILVDDKGFSRIDPKGSMMSVAAKWEDMNAFMDILVDRLISK